MSMIVSLVFLFFLFWSYWLHPELFNWCNLRVICSHLLQICVICKQIHGSCTQCCKCSTYYHAMCASRAGYRMEVSLLLFVCSHYIRIYYFVVASGFWSRSILRWYVNQITYLSGDTWCICLCILNMQLHCLEKNGKQITKMISYCAYHRCGFFS